MNEIPTCPGRDRMVADPAPPAGCQGRCARNDNPKILVSLHFVSLPQIFSLLVLINVLVGCSVLSGSGTSLIVVQWTTGSEINTAGFNLYRSDKAEGPFTRINEQLVPATNDPIAGGRYQYQDADVRSGQTYYYELEDVELNGTSTRHGPIVIVAPSGGGIEGAAPLLLLLGLGVLALSVLGSVWRARHPQTTKVVTTPKASK